MSTETSKGMSLPQTGTQRVGRTCDNKHHSLHTTFSPMESDSMQELIPFAREMLSQRPSRGLLKVYLLGSVFAVLGTVIGLVETVCHPFSSGEPMDEEMVLMLAREQRSVEAQIQHSVWGQEEEEEKEEELAHENEATTQTMTLKKNHTLSQRSMANRLHAS